MSGRGRGRGGIQENHFTTTAATPTAPANPFNSIANFRAGSGIFTSASPPAAPRGNPFASVEGAVTEAIQSAEGAGDAPGGLEGAGVVPTSSAFLSNLMSAGRRALQARDSVAQLFTGAYTLAKGSVSAATTVLETVNRTTALSSRVSQLRAWLSKPAPAMTLFRLVLSQSQYAGAAGMELRQTPELKQFLDFKLLADDEASLRLQDVALRQLALSVLQYMKYYTQVEDLEDVRAAVIRNLIYWRSVVNYHKAIKSRVVSATIGIVINPTARAMGELLIRPPSVVSWGGKEIKELDNADARVIIAVLADTEAVGPARELLEYLRATLGKPGGEITEKDIMNPERWNPPGLEGGAGAGAQIADLIKLLNAIPSEVRKLSKVQVPENLRGVLEVVRFNPEIGNVGSIGEGIDPEFDLEARMENVGGKLTEGSQHIGNIYNNQGKLIIAGADEEVNNTRNVRNTRSTNALNALASVSTTTLANTNAPAPAPAPAPANATRLSGSKRKERNNAPGPSNERKSRKSRKQRKTRKDRKIQRKSRKERKTSK